MKVRVHAARNRRSLRKTDLIRVPQHSPPNNRVCQCTHHGFAPDLRFRAAIYRVAFCVLHFAFALMAQACAKSPSSVAVLSPAPANMLDATQRLRLDIAQTTQLPGVQRGAWGVVVHSLDRNERLFELNPRMLLVPASVAKLAAVATAADAV